MTVKQTIKARYINGALEPLEPLDLDENNVVLVTVDELPHPEWPEAGRTFRVKPFPGGFAPGVDPANLKGLLGEMDDERFLRTTNS